MTHHIHIQSDTIAGPMAAAYLATYLPANSFKISINLTQTLKHNALFGTAHAHIKRFNKSIKLKELDFIQRTSAQFKLSERYHGFGSKPFHLPFADYGLVLEGVPLYRLRQVLGKSNHPSDLSPYCLPVLAAEADRFLLPDSKGRPILADYNYGYHFCVQSYADLLMEIALSKGVQNTSTFNNPDLFIDAQAADCFDHDWSTLGLGGSYSQAKHDPYKKSVANFEKHEDGYRLCYKTQAQTIALNVNRKSGDAIGLPSGREDLAWQGKTLMIGPAASGFEPILGLPLLSTQLDCERLIALFPPTLTALETRAPEAREYNRKWISSSDRLRDFQLLLLSDALTDDAKAKIDLFTSNGHLNRLDDDDILLEHWTPMLLGRDHMPARVDALAASVDKDAMTKQLDEMKSFIQKTVKSMPHVDDFISKTCPARPTLESKSSGI